MYTTNCHNPHAYRNDTIFVRIRNAMMGVWAKNGICAKQPLNWHTAVAQVLRIVTLAPCVIPLSSHVASNPVPVMVSLGIPLWYYKYIYRDTKDVEHSRQNKKICMYYLYTIYVCTVIAMKHIECCTGMGPISSIPKLRKGIYIFHKNILCDVDKLWKRILFLLPIVNRIIRVYVYTLQTQHFTHSDWERERERVDWCLYRCIWCIYIAAILSNEKRIPQASLCIITSNRKQSLHIV